jgi:hypothetical protein
MKIEIELSEDEYHLLQRYVEEYSYVDEKAAILALIKHELYHEIW